MLIIEWSKKYSVGIESMDNQHKKIIDLINKLSDAVDKGKGKNITGEILNELKTYGETHFRDEEKLMKAVSFPKLDKQIKQHRSFIKQLSDMIDVYEKSEKLMTLEIMNFMKTWFSDHIIQSDNKYGKFIRSKFSKNVGK